VADLPVTLAPELSARLSQALDFEGKIPRAFDALGPIHGADVVLVDDDADAQGDLRARQLTDLGARLTHAATTGLAGLRDGAADAVVSCWSWFRSDLPAELAAAERLLRNGGRVLVLHDYGRDDVSRLRAADLPEYTTWSRRDGWFLRSGFKLRVIHCWWTFETVEVAQSFLTDAFGEPGRAVAADLRRPRLSYNVAIYHRTKAGADGILGPVSSMEPGRATEAERR